MARQLGAIRLQGKVANVVGYKNPASSKANNNFLRERVYTVSNPKTQAQAYQRAKARPAQIFYNAFERVLNHAFLPSLRASRNRNRFISLAMKLNELPDLLKGEAFIPFCQYQIAAGALGLDDVAKAEMFESAPADTGFYWDKSISFPNLRGDDSLEYEASESIGAISEAIINNTTGVVAGMEVTFLAVVGAVNDPYQRVAQVISFVLDPSNDLTTLGDVCGDYIVFRRGANDSFTMTCEDEDYMILSAGLIISARSGNTYVYTNSKMAMSKVAADTLNGNEDAVLASYMGGSTSRSSDLILQQASNRAPGNRVIASSIAQIDIELAEGVSGTLSSSKAGIVTMTNGDKRVLIANALGQICDYADGVATPVTITPAGGSARPLTMADTTFDGNGAITIADVQLAGIDVSMQDGSLATITAVDIDGNSLAEGETKTAATGDHITVEGEGITADNVKVKNLSTNQFVSASSLVDNTAEFVTGDTNNQLYAVIINGAIWGYVITT